MPLAGLPAVERITARKTELDGLARAGALPMLDVPVVDEAAPPDRIEELRRSYPHAKVEVW